MADICYVSDIHFLFLQFEKEKAEKIVKRLETEKDTINTELIHARVEVTKMQSQIEKVISEKDSLSEQIQELKNDCDDTAKSKKEVSNNGLILLEMQNQQVHFNFRLYIMTLWFRKS